MKHMLFMLTCSILLTGLINCGGSSTTTASSSDDEGTTDDGATNDDSDENSFTASGSDLTIDDIVNDGSSSSLNSPTVVTSSSAAYYFGRFISQTEDGEHIYCGSLKFKLNKENSSSAYFSDASLLNLVEVVTGLTTTPIVTSSSDLDVDPNYDASSNHVEINNAASRFVAFDVDFGDNTYINDVSNSGVVISSDFLTMVGGNDETFFFIAQKADSQPDVTVNDIVDDWFAARFNVNTSTGGVELASTATISIDSPDSDDLSDFSGTDDALGDFSGIVSVTDATAGCFAYSYTGETLDGGFSLSADGSLAVGYDFDSGTYFGMSH